MIRIRVIFLGFGFWVFGIIPSGYAQETWQAKDSVYKETFNISQLDTIIQLSRQFIIQGSEVILLDSLRLIRGKDYHLDERFGLMKLKIRDSSYQTKPFRVTVFYKALPFSFRQKYQHRELVREIDSANKVHSVAKKIKNPFAFDDVIGKSKLQKSGSVVRGLTIGSNRDLSLNSGFRLQMAGNLTDDIEVIAALTDENSPIQPEGTTHT
ncbi:MAG: hypothetical protein HYZ34_08250, partial [Ignavibacteriae bacterium]|nr:hypothetical protein [Ignavibacteriota bacterium]